MNRGIIRSILIIALVAVFVGVAGDCYAQNALRKLGRGLANIVTGPLEILREVEDTFYDNGPAAAATYGVLSGIYKTVLREVVGAFEIVTFPLPVPADYAPVLEPEFMLSSDY